MSVTIVRGNVTALVLSVVTVVIQLACPRSAAAQSMDLTIFGGVADPLYEERLTFRAATPSLPGVDITAADSPVLRADGGPVFGAAVALEAGIFGIEGRFDSVGAGIEFSGAHYELRGTAFPFQDLTASLTAPEGRFDADRISLLSINARIRTPGRISIIASGGLSYLPDINVSGSVPLTVQVPDLPALAFDARLTLRGVPGESRHRFGMNGGAGIRIGGRVALTGEVRAFYFRDYELQFGSANGPELLDDLLAEADAVRFTPVFVNAQAGVSFRF